MFEPGDVVEFYSDVAGKPKYHLCLSLDACYFFMNSPKARAYPGDMIIPCAEVPFLPATPSGDSIVSCSMLLRFTEDELIFYGARKRGRVSNAILLQLLQFVENSTVLSDEDKAIVLMGLGDWI